MTYINSKTRIRASSFILTLVLATPAVLLGDDTEIFFSKTSSAGTELASVLFMFDTSGSMLDNKDGTPYTRIDRLKQAMIDVVENVDNVNVGIGAFNGSEFGGSILYPATDIDEDVCPDAACSAITIYAPIEHDNDDVEEATDGTMILNSDTLDLTQNPDGPSILTKSFPIVSAEDDAQELDDGTLDTSGAELQMFYNSASSPTAVGLRFQNIDLPVEANVLSAHIEFQSVANGAVGNIGSRVYTDRTEASPAFADVSGQKVTDRANSGDPMTWDPIDLKNGDGESVMSTNLAGLINERVQHWTWNIGDPITFMFTLPSWKSTNDENTRTFKSFESGHPPILHVTYTVGASENYQVGLRFAGIDIPRGATINHASVEFSVESYQSSDTNLTISGHSIGNSPVFTDSLSSLSGRTRTIASEPWSVTHWQTADPAEQTSDISSIIQEIVNRSDWCGGNALSVIFEGTGLRRAIAREGNQWEAPILKVEYDPRTIDFTDTCLTGRTSASIETSAGDVQENSMSDIVSSTDNTLSTETSGVSQLIGLRFTDVEVPANATVTKAYLEFQSAGFSGGQTDVQIIGEASGFSSPFDAATAEDVSGRSSISPVINWVDIPETTVGDSIRSPDISSIINAVVAQSTWTSGNAMALMLDPTSTGGQRLFSSFDTGQNVAPKLVVHYQRTSSMLAGEPATLRTARQDLIANMRRFRARGGTPLVDTYYEAAAYLLGKPVAYGLKRGQQGSYDRYFRLSADTTYSGGTLNRSDACTSANLNDVECVDEVLEDDPQYIAPDIGSCQPNQIVLLTDGSATKNTAGDLIKSMTSETSCESRSNDDEDCGLELAQWLKDTDHSDDLDGTQPIITHTVGFNFSSPFLQELAVAGGGKFYNPSSAKELTNAFKQIVTEAADVNTSFVAPSASVSQFNRLANSNDVYFAMFKPAAQVKWTGNLKKYALNKIDGKVTVVDKMGASVFDETTGGILDSARSFWSNADDGPDIAAGGAANKLTLSRTIKTFLYTNTGPSDLVVFSETNTDIDMALLGITGSDSAYRTLLLQWARGVDVLDFDGDGNTTEVRMQMGDPMHSTPFVINYPTTNPNGKSVAFVGTNEGFLHAIETEHGTEQFAFIPPDLLPILDTYFTNPPNSERPYGLDGPVTGWVDDTNHNQIADTDEDTYVYVGMRRGGRNYYALEVSDLTDPELAWVITSDDTGFEELGQTWSRPIKTKQRVNGVSKEVLIFSGGYDPGNDTKTSRNASDSMGRAIYWVDANDGTLLASVTPTGYSDMKYAIPSQPRVIDINHDGFADYLFVGDMGGQLWRFDIDNNGTSTLNAAITGGVIADLASVGSANNRRFYYEPDISLLRDDHGQDFLNIAIGSGWRAHPLDDEIDDRFYVLRDPAVFGPPRDEDGDISYPQVSESNLFNATSSSTRGDTSGRSANGFYIELAADGEKVLSAATTVNGNVLFTTYVPDNSSTQVCSIAVGGGRLYAIDALTSDPVLDLDTSGENPDAFTLTDRSQELGTPGIPPGVSALIPEIDKDSPTILVGLEQPATALDFGQLFRRTFWAETID